jgi:hypothetical protein
MKTKIIAVGGIGFLVLFVGGFASIFEIRLASAQVGASSSPPVSTTTPPDLVASTSTALIADGASSTPGLGATSTTADASTTAVSTTTTGSSSEGVSAHATTKATSPEGTSTPAIGPPPEGLALVHIIGTKYTDYFTAGTTTFAFPGDPAFDSHFSEPNAPIPTHEGLTWVHTTGGYLYDTPSGDLEVGDYAVQLDNSYIENAPPFVSATSTPAQIATSTTSNAAADTSSSPSNDVSSSVPDTSTSTVPSPSVNSSSTTTSSEPIPRTL